MSLRHRLEHGLGRIGLLGRALALRSGLVTNPLFDHEWYRSRYSDAPADRRRAYRAYRRRPLSEPRDPNRYLDMRWLLETQPDLLQARMHPLDHYMLVGWSEGREPKPGFDTPDFLRRHPDCAKRGMNPVVYLLQSGVPAMASTLSALNPAPAGEDGGSYGPAAADPERSMPGAARLVHGSIVEGWLDDDVEVTEVEVTCDAEVIWRGRPRRTVADVNGVEHARGFRVDLPPATIASRRSLVLVRTLDGDRLRGSPMVADCLDRFEGHIDELTFTDGVLAVDGWVHDRARPLDPLEVEVLSDGHIAATVVANHYRPDLERCGLGVGRHALRSTVRLPAPADKICLRIGGTPLLLSEEQQVAAIPARPNDPRPALAEATPADDPGQTPPSAVTTGLARGRTSDPSAVTTLAFAVTEVNERGGTGDYFTALELGSAIEEQTGWRVVYLDMARDWYELDDVDVLMVMRDEFDLSRAKQRRPGLVAAAWARNWFDRWAERPWLHHYDLVWASSQRGSTRLSDAIDRDVPVLPMATNTERFGGGGRRPELATDYCFTGSFFYAPREIMYDLEPAGLPFEFGVFGHGWEHAPTFTPYVRGPVPYPSVPDVYASTKLVIDDAQFPVKAWGSVNCRVFDALAAGAMVVTNGDVGAAELFGDALPTYSNKQELDELVLHYLSDESARAERVSKLKALVVGEHSYGQRARLAVAGIQALRPS